MERAPKEKEGFSESVETEVVEEASEGFEEKKDLGAFKAQLNSGLEFYRHVAGEDVEEIDIHPETQLFFSYVSENDPVEVKKAVRVPLLTEYGVQINNKLYEFKDSYKNELLRFEAGKHTRFADNIEDFYESLEEDNSEIRKTYIEKLHKRFTREAQRPYAEKKLEYAEKIRGRYLQNSPWSFGKKFILEENPDLTDAEASAVYRAALRFTSAKMDTDAYERSDRMSMIHDSTAKNGIREMTAEEKAEEVELRRKRYNEDYTVAISDFKGLNLEPVKLISRANREFVKAQAEFITSSGYMIPEEYEEYKNYSRELGKLTDKIPRYMAGRPGILRLYGNLTNSIKIAAREEFDRKTPKDDLDRSTVRLALSSVRQKKYRGFKLEKKDMLRKVLSPEMVKKLDQEYSEENNPDAPVDTPEEAMRTLEEVLVDITGNKDPYHINGEIQKLCHRYYFDLVEKFQRGKIKFGVPTDGAKKAISENNERLTREMHLKVEKATYELAGKSAGEIGKKIAERALDEEDVKDAYFTPAGCFVRHADDRCTTHPISPFDARVEAALDESEAKAWREAWAADRRKHLDRKNNPDGLADFVNTEFRRSVAEYAEALDGDSYERLQKMREELNLGMDGIFDRRGELNHLPTSNEIEILGEVMPSIANFIGNLKVNFNAIKEDGYHKINGKGISQNLQKLISGQEGSARFAYPADLILVNDSGVTLNFYPYRKILHESGYDQEAAKGVLYSCLGYGILSRMRDDEFEDYARFLGDKARVSKQAIYRNYGIMVNSPLERREIAVRTYFVSDFAKYALGIADEKTKRYFDALKGV